MIAMLRRSVWTCVWVVVGSIVVCTKGAGSVCPALVRGPSRVPWAFPLDTRCGPRAGGDEPLQFVKYSTNGLCQVGVIAPIMVFSFMEIGATDPGQVGAVDLIATVYSSISAKSRAQTSGCFQTRSVSSRLQYAARTAWAKPQLRILARSKASCSES